MQISLHSAKLAINITANRKIWQVLLLFFFKEIVNPLLPIDPNQKKTMPSLWRHDDIITDQG